MIIECICGQKKFEVNSDLIPETGRNIQCGSCDKIWFFNPSLQSPSQISPKKDIDEKNIQKQKIYQEEELISQDFSNKVEVNEKILKDKKQTSFKISKILSYIVVGIISFVALIIVLETFKSPLGNIFSGLELLLYNLFETIKDVFLFIKDLFI
tara:strand:- start:738 stop:1199 length:462 start_codon:yes stop_codon:yes gene_type:complete